MGAVETVTLEVPDAPAAEAFYSAAFGVDGRVRVWASQPPSTGFPGFTMSLVVAQPATVNALMESAAAAGATVLKPAAKSLWGYGVVRSM